LVICTPRSLVVRDPSRSWSLPRIRPIPLDLSSALSRAPALADSQYVTAVTFSLSPNSSERIPTYSPSAGLPNYLLHSPAFIASGSAWLKLELFTLHTMATMVRKGQSSLLHSNLLKGMSVSGFVSVCCGRSSTKIQTREETRQGGKARVKTAKEEGTKERI